MSDEPTLATLIAAPFWWFARLWWQGEDGSRLGAMWDCCLDLLAGEPEPIITPPPRPEYARLEDEVLWHWHATFSDPSPFIVTPEGTVYRDTRDELYRKAQYDLDRKMHKKGLAGSFLHLGNATQLCHDVFVGGDRPRMIGDKLYMTPTETLIL